MCGRFTLLARLAALKERFDIRELAEDYAPEYNSYNIAPTQAIPGVIRSKKGNKLVSFKWSYTVGDHIVINARDDRILDSATYYKSFQQFRCLIPSDGFYEWETVGKKKIPFYIRLQSKETYSYAGIYRNTGQVLESAIITTKPNSIVEPIHDRMPVILPKNVESEWLSPDTPEENLLEMLEPLPAELMEKIQVSTKVNSVLNTSSDLIKPHISLKQFLK